jgi:hypothetical protein
MHARVSVTAIHDLRTTRNANAAHAGTFCVLSVLSVLLWLLWLRRTTTGILRRSTHVKRVTRSACELIRSEEFEVGVRCASCGQGLLDSGKMVITDAVSMERSRASEHEPIAGEFRFERRDPRVEYKVGNVLLELTQSVSPDLGRKGHTVRADEERRWVRSLSLKDDSLDVESSVRTMRSARKN